MDTAKAEAVADIVRTFLEKMTLPSEVSVREPLLPIQGEFVCDIRTEEGSNLLIGQRGLNLEALQALVRLAVRRKYEGWSNFSIDVNAYWTEKARALLSEAKDAELRAHRDKTSVFLRPMTPFERKCVHLALADSETVLTESTGTGENRKIIIKPKGDL